MENDRRNKANRDRLDRIQKGYLRFSKRVAIAITIQGVGLILGLVVAGYAIKENRDVSNEVKEIAISANVKSEQNRIRQALNTDKVCSQSSNQPVACRALFERLSRNISDEQRRALACAVLEQMRGATARTLRRETKCNMKGGP